MRLSRPGSVVGGLRRLARGGGGLRLASSCLALNHEICPWPQRGKKWVFKDQKGTYRKGGSRERANEGW